MLIVNWSINVNIMGDGQSPNNWCAAAWGILFIRQSHRCSFRVNILWYFHSLFITDFQTYLLLDTNPEHKMDYEARRNIGMGIGYTLYVIVLISLLIFLLTAAGKIDQLFDSGLPLPNTTTTQ